MEGTYSRSKAIRSSEDDQASDRCGLCPAESDHTRQECKEYAEVEPAIFIRYHSRQDSAKHRRPVEDRYAVESQVAREAHGGGV